LLIQRAPDRYEKLRHLGAMATDDILAPASTDERTVPRPDWSGIAASGGRTQQAGVYRAAMPSGKRISLLRVMFTDHCIMDCHYCPNSHWVPRRRYGFKVDELAALFDEMYRRQAVAGLFLSSGIFRDSDRTQERLLDVVEAIRNRYGFRGYIHLKVMPGVMDPGLVDAAHRLGTRLSVNMEAPTAGHLAKLSKIKRFDEGILAPMRQIHDANLAQYGGAVGQATQLVVGAADETDLDIYARMRNLYGEMGFKRVYYSAFRPVKYTPLEEHPATPKVREQRLYQMDWLSRFYGFDDGDLRLAFDDTGSLNHRVDPKLMIASQQAERFPIDINHADESSLMRVPGVGPKAASRIIAQRRQHSITHWRELQAMGVVWKRAQYFVYLPGHKPEPSRQGEFALDFAAPQQGGLREEPGPVAAHSSHRGHKRSRSVADIHERHIAHGCTECPMAGATCGAGYQMPSPQPA